MTAGKPLCGSLTAPSLLDVPCFAWRCEEQPALQGPASESPQAPRTHNPALRRTVACGIVRRNPHALATTRKNHPSRHDPDTSRTLGNLTRCLNARSLLGVAVACAFVDALDGERAPKSGSFGICLNIAPKWAPKARTWMRTGATGADSREEASVLRLPSRSSFPGQGAYVEVPMPRATTAPIWVAGGGSVSRGGGLTPDTPYTDLQICVFWRGSRKIQKNK